MGPGIENSMASLSQGGLSKAVFRVTRIGPLFLFLSGVVLIFGRAIVRPTAVRAVFLVLSWSVL